MYLQYVHTSDANTIQSDCEKLFLSFLPVFMLFFNFAFIIFGCFSEISISNSLYACFIVIRQL